MFAVTVIFTLHDGRMPEFLPLMMENAKTSLTDEPGCNQFDVCTEPDREGEVFLYELYTDAAAFQAHLATPHYKTFDANVAEMIAHKEVRLYRNVAQ